MQLDYRRFQIFKWHVRRQTNVFVKHYLLPTLWRKQRNIFAKYLRCKELQIAIYPDKEKNLKILWQQKEKDARRELYKAKTQFKLKKWKTLHIFRNLKKNLKTLEKTNIHEYREFRQKTPKSLPLPSTLYKSQLAGFKSKSYIKGLKTFFREGFIQKPSLYKPKKSKLKYTSLCLI